MEITLKHTQASQREDSSQVVMSLKSYWNPQNVRSFTFFFSQVWGREYKILIAEDITAEEKTNNASFVYGFCWLRLIRQETKFYE